MGDGTCRTSRRLVAVRSLDATATLRSDTSWHVPTMPTSSQLTVLEPYGIGLVSASEELPSASAVGFEHGEPSCLNKILWLRTNSAAGTRVVKD